MGPAIETATFKAGHPSILDLHIATEIYEIEYSFGWEFISAIVTEVEMHTKVALLSLPA